jgi:hypothetical protein
MKPPFLSFEVMFLSLLKKNWRNPFLFTLLVLYPREHKPVIGESPNQDQKVKTSGTSFPR